MTALLPTLLPGDRKLLNAYRQVTGDQDVSDELLSSLRKVAASRSIGEALRAVRWYEDSGSPEESFQKAFQLVSFFLSALRPASEMAYRAERLQTVLSAAQRSSALNGTFVVFELLETVLGTSYEADLKLLQTARGDLIYKVWSAAVLRARCRNTSEVLQLVEALDVTDADLEAALARLQSGED